MILWLASGSPRRRLLLEWSGWALEVHPPRIDESRRPGEDPVDYARRLALEKARTSPRARLALAGDTVVHRGQRILDKPRDREEAASHLRQLAGSWHRVTTGICVRRDGQEALLAVTSRVRLRDLAEEEIRAYVDSGDADDKAGAYGIQGRGGALVAEVRGSWTNVMGLPLEETLEALEALAVRRRS